MVYRKKAFVAPQIRSYQGDAIIRYGGLKFYLGQWDGTGTPPRDVMARYLRAVAELEEQFQRGEPASKPDETPEDLPLDVLIARYIIHLEQDPDGYRKPDGTLSPQYAKSVRALRVLSALYGNTYASDFTASCLKRCRKAMVNASWWFRSDDRPKERPAKPWGPSVANAATSRIVRLFAWLESEDMAPKGTAEHLRTVQPLSLPDAVDESEKAVPDAVVDATLPYTSPVVSAMIKLQRLTAMRPSELCRLSPREIDCRRSIWIYRPSKHKTAWRGKSRSIPLGPAAQAILAPFLERNPQSYCFSPREAFFWWMDQRSAGAVESTRKTPVYPSETRRRNSAKERTRKATRRKFSQCYTSYTYRRAIRHAVDRARADKKDVPYWSPYALRHARITEVQYEHGWETAAAVGGNTVQMARVYAHRAEERAIDLASRAALPQPPSREDGLSGSD